MTNYWGTVWVIPTSLTNYWGTLWDIPTSLTMCEFRGRRRRRGGGIRQQQNDDSSSDDTERSRSPCDVVDTSELGHDLLRNFAWGDLSAPQAQQMAAEAINDTRAALVKAGVREPNAHLGQAIIRLASAGSWGNSPQNCQQQILKDFGLDSARHLLHPLQDSIAHYIIHPHAFFSWLHHHKHRHFLARFGADPTKLQTWWGKFKNTPKGRRLFRDHPHLQHRTHLQYTIPIAFHVDAGPIAKKHSAAIASWSAFHGGVVGDDSTLNTLTATWVSTTHNARTDNKFWDEFQRSLEILQLGKDGDRVLAPVHGTDKCWTAVMVHQKADLEEMCNKWGLNHYNSEHVCGFCLANRSTHQWNHTSPRALWIPTIFTRPTFLAYYRTPHNYHPLWDFPGIGPDTIGIDLLHVTDDKGVASIFIGSLFMDLIRSRALGNHNFEQGLDIINDQIYDHYNVTRELNRVPKLGESNLTVVNARGSTFPQLRGPGIKAANTRCLMKFCVTLARTYDDGTDYSRHRRRAAACFQDFYDLVYSSGELPDLSQHNAFFSFCLCCFVGFVLVCHRQ